LGRKLIESTREKNELRDSMKSLGAELADLQEQYKIMKSLKIDLETILDRSISEKAKLGLDLDSFREQYAAKSNEIELLSQQLRRFEQEKLNVEKELDVSKQTNTNSEQAVSALRASMNSLEKILTQMRSNFQSELDKNEDISLELLRLIKERNLAQTNRISLAKELAASNERHVLQFRICKDLQVIMYRKLIRSRFV
jgi:chromosome segregation ATPase